MVSVNLSEEMPSFSFSGKSHRIFIEGRGFDFESFDVYNNNTASLNLVDLDDPLFTILEKLALFNIFGAVFNVIVVPIATYGIVK